jgi:hypothetical protein
MTAARDIPTNRDLQAAVFAPSPVITVTIEAVGDGEPDVRETERAQPTPR